MTTGNYENPDPDESGRVGGNVTSGDVNRFCLGRDPTCTAINQCLPCWEHNLLTCVIPAMRDGGQATTAAQVAAFARRYREGAKATLCAARQEDPGAFATSMQVRRAMIERAWQEVRELGLPEPTYPFALVAMEQSPAPTASGFSGPEGASAPTASGFSGPQGAGAPATAGARSAAGGARPAAGGIPIGVPLGPTGAAEAATGAARPSGGRARATPNGGARPAAGGARPAAGGIPIGVPLDHLGGGTATGGSDPADFVDDDPPLARGDVRRIVKNGTRSEVPGASTSRAAKQASVAAAKAEVNGIPPAAGRAPPAAGQADIAPTPPLVAPASSPTNGRDA